MQCRMHTFVHAYLCAFVLFACFLLFIYHIFHPCNAVYILHMGICGWITWHVCVNDHVCFYVCAHVHAKDCLWWWGCKGSKGSSVRFTLAARGIALNSNSTGGPEVFLNQAPASLSQRVCVLFLKEKKNTHTRPHERKSPFFIYFLYIYMPSRFSF